MTDYLLQRQSRRTLAIRVGPAGQVEVRAPRHLPRAQIEAFLQQRQDWIRAQQAAQRLRAQAPGWREGRPWWHWGQPLQVGLDDRLSAVHPAGDRLWLPLPASAAEAELTACLQAWQLQQARVLLPSRLAAMRALAAARGLTRQPERLTVRAMRTRWGSCTARGRISLSSQLLHLPPSLVDYVICHELAHLMEMNHGPGFWRLLEHWHPGAKKAQAAVAHWARRLAQPQLPAR